MAGQSRRKYRLRARTAKGYGHADEGEVLALLMEDTRGDEVLLEIPANLSSAFLALLQGASNAAAEVRGTPADSLMSDLSHIRTIDIQSTKLGRVGIRFGLKGNMNFDFVCSEGIALKMVDRLLALIEHSERSGSTSVH